MEAVVFGLQLAEEAASVVYLALNKKDEATKRWVLRRAGQEGVIRTIQAARYGRRARVLVPVDCELECSQPGTSAFEGLTKARRTNEGNAMTWSQAQVKEGAGGDETVGVRGKEGN